MSDNHMTGSGEDGVFSPVGHAGAAAETAGDPVDQVNPVDTTDGNAVDLSYGEQNEKSTAEEMGRDDTFVDCPDEIEYSDSQQNTEEKDNQIDEQSTESNSGIKVQDLVAEIEHLRDMHENAIAEKERSAQEYEEERAVLVKELAQLCYQLKVPNEQQTAPGENVNGSVDHSGANWDVKSVGSGASLHEIISECSRFLKNALEDRSRAEEKVGELDSVIYRKDQEIDLLNAKVTELSESIHISKHETSSQLYELQHVEETTNRILALVYGTHHQDYASAGSLTEQISSIENSVIFLVEKCNTFVSESDQLRGVLNEVGVDYNMIDEIGIFAIARDKISELGRKEQSLYQNISSLQDENRKLVEQLDQQKSIVENLNAEIGRLSAEVEQERHRYASMKEKLSMAVSKGKTLVQHRDSLKRMLAEKTSELEKLTTELQEKSASMEAAEKTKELVEETEKLAASLQESLAKRDAILGKCEEILSEIVVTEDPQLTDITEKLSRVADENKSLKAISLQYHKVTDALLLIDFPETVASSELDIRIHWLAESFNLTKEEASILQSEIAKTKEAASLEIEHLTTSFLLETQEKSYLHAEMEDLRNTYDAWERLQYEHAETRNTLNREINYLKDLVSSESQQKSYLQLELENLKHEYERIVQKEYLASLEKHKIVSMLLEASGLAAGGHEEVHLEHSDMTTMVNRCLAMIIENTSHIEPSLVDDNKLERFKSLLYITNQELSLYRLIVEEDKLHKMQVRSLSDELQMKTQELNALNNEKTTMQKSFDQLEDRCALLKEKLSMAVKKGKGLVQERETMKGVLNEKNAEIDRLKSELQQSLSKCTEWQDQISKMSLDMERLPLLEAEIVASKGRGDQLEQFLAESNSMLQRVMESIEGIRNPTDLTFEEPAEKIKWIAGSLSEHETSNVEMEQELRKVKDEASSLASKLSEAHMMLKSLEGSLSNVETSRSQLLDEKKELEVSKALLEEELQSEKEKASSLISKFNEVSSSKRALEDALSQAEDNVSRFMNERDIAEESRARAEEQLHILEEELHNETKKSTSHISSFEELSASKRAVEDALSQAEDNVSRLMNERDIAIESRDLAEEQLQKLKAELSDHMMKLADETEKSSQAEDNISRSMNERDIAIESRDLAEEQQQKLKAELSDHMIKLADAEKIIQSLEDALSQAQENISSLAKANNQVQIGRDDLDSEIMKLRAEGDSYASKLSDASLTIKSLEDALANAENNMADLVEGKKNAEQEILSLTSKLESCTEELAEARGSIENLSIKLSSQLSHLQLVLKDETLSSLLGQCFKRKFESLGNMDSLLKEMWEHNLEMDSDVMLQSSPILEDDSTISMTLPSSPDITLSSEMLNDEVNAVDHEGILSHIEKMNEKFHLKHKILSDKVDSLSTHMDKSITTLLRRLHTSKDRIVSIMKYAKDLRQQVKDMEKYKQRQEEAVTSLEGDLRILSSSCADATKGLESNVQKNASELIPALELVKLDGIKSMDLGTVEDAAVAALWTDHVQTAERLLLATRRNQDLTKLFQVAINKLISVTEDMQEEMKETQLTIDELLREQDLYKGRISKLEADQRAQENFHHEMAVKLDGYKEREDLLRKREEELSTSLSKVQEYEGFPLSEAQVKLILDKMNEVELPDTYFALQDSHDSANVRKLFYVVDTFGGTQQKVHILSRENEELQSMIDTQILEIETLQKQVENYMDSSKSSDKINRLLELESSLQNIVRKLGGSVLMSDLKLDGEMQLLPLLDKLVTTTIVESENLKLKNEELGDKLLGTQKFVDDLSNKVKSLEDSNQARAVQPEVVQEAGTTSKAPLSTQSEISEAQDLAAIGKSNNVHPVTSAAHVRTLRKGSNDHLALSIDSDSERLVDNKESDEDKGHVFKSLNTSGLIPRQGRTVADRIDGIWVSGSRALMSHPRGRLGLLTYWIVVHIWLLGTFL